MKFHFVNNQKANKISKKSKRLIREEEQLKKEENKKKVLAYFVIFILVLHLAGSFIGMQFLEKGSDKLNIFFDTIKLNGQEFFSEMFITGLFLYFLCVGLYYLGFIEDKFKATIIVFSTTISISILLASDKVLDNETTNLPESYAQLLYIFITKHHALLILFVLTILLAILVFYYLIRSVFVVQFSSTGIHINLPGQTFYYLPIFPQKSWQNTKITIKKGEKYWVELYGYVSPGALQQTYLLKDQMEAINQLIKMNNNEKAGDQDKKLNEIINEKIENQEKLIWPYSEPIGYPKSYYSKDQMIPVLKENTLYKEEFYYEKDKELTVRGLTHNKVVAFIKGEDDPDSEPREANKSRIGGYDWNNHEDREKLICLSKDHYPFMFEAKKTGELYVVINDVDRARWDNSGLFFLKLTKSSF